MFTKTCFITIDIRRGTLERIIQMHMDFYNRLKDEAHVWKALEQKNIQILDGFQNQIELVRLYYQRMYTSKKQRIVLCGINPGKNGAGKTGIPFIDFKGASQLLPEVNETSSENSAQFILSVIDEIGVQEYHNLVYMTNISWYGFKKDRLSTGNTIGKSSYS